MKDWIANLTIGDKVIVVTNRAPLPDFEKVCRIVKNSYKIITIAYYGKNIRFSNESQREIGASSTGMRFVQWSQEEENLIRERNDRDNKIYTIKMFMRRQFTNEELLKISSYLPPEAMELGKVSQCDM